MKDQIKSYAFLVILAGVVVALDQWTKYLVRSLLPLRGIWVPWDWLSPYARIVHWDNSGVAFGLFQGSGAIFLVLALVVAAVIFYYYPRIAKDDWILKIALGLQLGGALGNVVDRILFNFRVTDFISVGDFPVFNIADSSISVGVAVLLVGVWLQERKAGKKAALENLETLSENNSEHEETTE